MEIPKIQTEINNKPILQQNQTPNQYLNSIPGQIIQSFVKINGEKSNKVYQKICFLGKGGFAQCFLTKQKDTDRSSAMKVIPKKLLDSQRTKLRLANEIKLHKSLHNEYTVELYNHFQDEENVYINLELCQFGSINDLLRARYTFSVPEVQSFVYGICHGLKYLHSRNIIHRDLKLGNIFLGENMKVKIGDFGLACKLQFTRQYKRTVCGTPNYIAPQVLQSKGYYFEVDIWALGIIIFTLFFTIPPFETEDAQQTYHKIKKGEYQFPKYYEVPFQAIDLIKKILVSNPSNRPTLQQILDSPFMKLGGSIPLGLPPLVMKRAPSKKQLVTWPSIMTKQTRLSKVEGNSFVLDFFGFTKRRESNAGKMEMSVNKKQCVIKQVDPLRGIICRIIQQVQDELLFFYLNNGNYGVYNMKKQQVYTCQLGDKSQKGLQTIQHRFINDSGASQQQKIPGSACQHRVLLAIKQKQLLQKKLRISIQEDVSQSITVVKIKAHKDLFMIKFSNKVIQIIFKEKDGFVIGNGGKCMQYFCSFQAMEMGKEISYTNLMKIGEIDRENQVGISNVINLGKQQKSLLTLKKVMYLKGIVKETVNHVHHKKCV